MYARDLTVHGVHARTGGTYVDAGDRQARADAGKPQWISGMDHLAQPWIKLTSRLPTSDSTMIATIGLKSKAPTIGMMRRKMRR